jgi:hypothetical protein
LKWAVLVLVGAVAIVRFALLGAMSASLEVTPPPLVAHYGVQLPRSPSHDGTERVPGPFLNPDGDREDAGTVTDLEGDEVTSAVATYRIDRQGNLYELHAPHTEVAHLSSPVG